MTQINTNEIELSDDQQLAFDRIKHWSSHESESKPELSLGGYAGTGKTTILRKLIDDLESEGHHVHSMALTGKAVSVLHRKGLRGSRTIHSSIYHAYMVDKKLVFELREDIEGRPTMLVVDEASMVSQDLYDDLKSFSTPILWVGDHGQLEPVGKNPGVMVNPDVRLEKIHRQAEGNPIIMFADKVRRGVAPFMAKPSGESNILVTERRKLDQGMFGLADQVICVTNRTRVKINKYVRSRLGYPPDEPIVGDKVICLLNSRKNGIFNGLQGVISAISQGIHNDAWDVTIDLENGSVYRGDIHKGQFNREKGLIEAPKNLWGATFWDYAYAITCHKSQGSEWDRVVVVEEPCGSWLNMKRWRYTSVTRAAEGLVYAC